MNVDVSRQVGTFICNYVDKWHMYAIVYFESLMLSRAWTVCILYYSMMIWCIVACSLNALVESSVSVQLRLPDFG